MPNGEGSNVRSERPMHTDDPAADSCARDGIEPVEEHDEVDSVVGLVVIGLHPDVESLTEQTVRQTVAAADAWLVGCGRCVHASTLTCRQTQPDTCTYITRLEYILNKAYS